MRHVQVDNDNDPVKSLYDDNSRDDKSKEKKTIRDFHEYTKEKIFFFTRI